MTEYAFFAEKADRWGKDMASLLGNFNSTGWNSLVILRQNYPP